MTRFTPRRGFTLIELLVVMALIATLAAIAMIVAPGIMDKDRSVDAVTSLESQFQIARARALRDRLPRGVRLIVDANGRATETQYIESPPVLVFNQNPPYPNGFVNASGTPTPAGSPNAVPHPLTPRVEFAYTVTAVGNPGAGTILSRQCVIRGLDTDQATQLVNAANSGRQPSLWLPVLGTWHRLIAPPNVSATAGASPSFDVAITLDQYPDMQLGASTSYVTYHFGIYLPPRPLLGEPVMQLPTRTCVDLNPGLSMPAGAANTDYDILFAPNGQLAFTANVAGNVGGAGHVFLWIRDFTKFPNDGPFPVTPPLTWNTYSQSDFQIGGEMMLLAIKAKSGAIGAAPVNWPDGAIGITGPPPGGNNYDPYFFARKAVAGP